MGCMLGFSFAQARHAWLTAGCMLYLLPLRSQCESHLMGMKPLQGYADLAVGLEKVSEEKGAVDEAKGHVLQVSQQIIAQCRCPVKQSPLSLMHPTSFILALGCRDSIYCLSPTALWVSGPDVLDLRAKLAVGLLWVALLLLGIPYLVCLLFPSLLYLEFSIPLIACEIPFTAAI